MNRKSEPLNFLLAVVDPDYQIGVDVALFKNRKLFNSAIKFAEKNGLYYFFISRLREMGVNMPKLEEDKWMRENQRLLKLKRTLSLLNRVSRDYSIKYSIIKACNTIPHVPRDIDVFVENRSYMYLIKALKNNGMRCVRSGEIETSLLRDGYLKIDVYTSIHYFGINFLNEEILTKNIRNETLAGCPILNAETDLLLMLIHSIAHGSLTLLDFLHIKNLIKEANIATCRRYSCQMGWERTFNLALGKIIAIYKEIYEDRNFLHFPYFFSLDFIVGCISQVKKMDEFNKQLLYITITLDQIGYKLRNTFLYELLKKSEAVKYLIDLPTVLLKSIRGDRK